MKAEVTNKYSENEINVKVEGRGVLRLDYSKLGNIKIKKGDKFEGYHAGGSFVAEKIV